MVDAPRRQQLLRTNDAELLAQLRPDQILSAVAARERQVGGVVKRTVRPVGDQAGVFVVRMSGDVEDAAEHVQLLKRETSVCGIHRLGCLGGATSARQANDRKQRHEAARERKHDRERFAMKPAGPGSLLQPVDD